MNLFLQNYFVNDRSRLIIMMLTTILCFFFMLCLGGEAMAFGFVIGMIVMDVVLYHRLWC